jgi:enoyl-CoA hydratase
MTTRVQYELKDGIAAITLDDGKANVLSLDMLSEINAALDRAAADNAAVLLCGRTGTFSGGFHLPTMMGGGINAVNMLRAGFELSHRLLSFRSPVVAACTGHALAMGAFLLLSVDYRVGADGAFKVGANEVAIGLSMPRFGVEICRQRLSPAHWHRAVINAEIYTPAASVVAGFLDRVVPQESVIEEARAELQKLAKYSRSVHTATKLRLRESTLAAIRDAIEKDDVEFRGLMKVS